MSTLSSTIAGSWYPASAAELRHLLERDADAVPAVRANHEVPNILLLPHAGYAYSAATAMFGIKRIIGSGYRRVILLAPSHRCRFFDRFVAPGSDSLSTPLGTVPVDREAIALIASEFTVDYSDAIHAGEHATQIELPLLQYALTDFSIVPLIVSELTENGIRRVVPLLHRLLDGETLLVVSSDFTHYGERFDFAPFPPDRALSETMKLDFAAFHAIETGSAAQFEALLDKTGATICGRNPIRLLLHLIPPATRFELLHYATSAESTGDTTDFVCYLCAAGYARWQAQQGVKPQGPLSASDRRTLLTMARNSIEYTLRTGRLMPASCQKAEIPPAMRQAMGCFVTLNSRSSGALRGCIGEIEPRRPLYEAVTARAVDAAFRDPRFPRLTEDEWPDIRIEISALTPPRPVSSWREIEIGRHGMILEKAGHTAVFLPQVATEQHWDLPTTLSHLARKAGLGADDWREGAHFTVFEATVFQEQ